MSRCAKVRTHSLVYVFQDPHHADNRSGINPFAQGLVVEAYVAAGDWSFQLFASLGHAVDGLRELPHHLRFLGIAEVQTIRRRDRRRARAGHIARRLSDGVHGAQLGVEVAPTPVTIERHRQTTVRALYPDNTALTTRSLDSVGLHHGVILLKDPTLRADVRARQQTLQVVRELSLLTELDAVRDLARYGRFPTYHRPAIHRRLIGECGIGDLRHDFPMLQNAHRGLINHAANSHGIESPLLEDAKHFVLAPPFCHQQHAFLRLAQHDLVGSHARLALRNQVEFDFQAHTAAPTHLTGRAS